MLGKIKPYQNLSLIILSISLLLAIILSRFSGNVLSYISACLFISTGFFTILFIILSLPFYLSKRTGIAILTNELINIEVDGKPTEFNLEHIKFLLNIDIKTLQNEARVTSEIIKGLPKWGNYIILPSGSSAENTYILFLPDEDFLSMHRQLNIETYKNKRMLMSDTNELFKNFMGMLWGAS